ncbi:MAG: hypothetical protein BEN18_09670 [Epulopiscium sp. Nuni2H_MBin001]|nr:MAG: hypothetical protein BEN18_09670 [Epulopiscium sp. Nuni2H_MBin001]
MNDNALAQQFNSRSLIKYAIPTIIMMIFNSTAGIIDGIFVANFVNENALAATNLVMPIILVMIALGMMLATGSNAQIAKLLGEGKDKEARETFSVTYLVGIIFGVTVSILLYIFANPLLNMIGANEVLYPYARDYLLTITPFMTCAMLQMFTQCFFVTAGKPQIGFMMCALGTVTNIVLDYVLIVYLDMGIVGAALATCTSFAISGISGLIYFLFYRKGSLYLCKPKWNTKQFLHCLHNGMSEFITMMAASITTILFNIILMQIAGESGVAAITVIMYVQMIQSAVYTGYSIGVAPLISYKFGEKSYEQLKLINKASFIAIGIASLLTITLSIVFAKLAVGVFISPSSDTFILTVKGFRIYSLAYVSMGFNIFVCAMFTALSNGKVSAIISALRTLVFIIIALITLPFIFGLNGVWIAVPIAEALGLIVAFIYFKKNKDLYNYY